ncbi:MAG TPA: DUF2238 domain-containing protein [Candidatus Thermoplasmatota archaeon]
MGWVHVHKFPLTLLAAYLAVWGFLAIEPLSRSDWILENLLVALTLPLLIIFHRRLQISRASDVLLFVFYTLHAVGGHWSYSNVPFIPWEEMGFQRNHFDRIVHFGFGLLLWLPLRNAIKQFTKLGATGSGVFALSVIWALSGLYEVIEWGAVAVVSPELGQEFLGAQGDEFDASKDMALAMGGALLAFALERIVQAVRRRATTPVQATVRTIPGAATSAKVGHASSGAKPVQVATKPDGERRR